MVGNGISEPSSSTTNFSSSCEAFLFCLSFQSSFFLSHYLDLSHFYCSLQCSIASSTPARCDLRGADFSSEVAVKRFAAFFFRCWIYIQVEKSAAVAKIFLVDRGRKLNLNWFLKHLAKSLEVNHSFRMVVRLDYDKPVL